MCRFKRFVKWVVVMVFLLFVVNVVFVEIYKWVDDNGKVYFIDCKDYVIE